MYSWVFRLLLLMCMLCVTQGYAAGPEPINTAPDFTKNTWPTGQNTFNRQEIGNTLSRYFPTGFVYSGGNHSTSASCVAGPFLTEAFSSYPGGYHMSGNGLGGSASINYATIGANCSNPGSDVCWVVMSPAGTATLPSSNFTRAGTSNYYADCVSSVQPTLPENAAWLQRTEITNGQVSAIQDLRQQLWFSSTDFPEYIHNTTTLFDEVKSREADRLHATVESDCVPAVPSPASLTLASFACTGYVNSAGKAIYVHETGKAVGPLNNGNGTYWLILHPDRSSAIVGWNRTTDSHYLWTYSAAAPTIPAGTLLFALVTVESGAITAVEVPGNWTISGAVSPEDYATSGVTDTVAVQAAFDSGRPVRFLRNYFVTTVKIGGVGRHIDFNGYGLVGKATTPTTAVLQITGRQLTLLRLAVDVRFNSQYTACYHWHSEDVGAGVQPAQYVNAYGMHCANATYGLIYGAVLGGTSVSAAQSENTVRGLTGRAVQFPFYGNQTNGFLTLISPILDCNPYEWFTIGGVTGGAAQTAWYLASLAFRNDVGVLTIVGGEILKPSDQNGYGMYGKDFFIDGSAIEIASSQALLTGSATISRNTGGFMSGDSAVAFVLRDGAVTGTLALRGYVLARGEDVAIGSGVQFIRTLDDGLANYTLDISDSDIGEWRWDEQQTFAYDNITVLLRNVFFHTSVWSARVTFPGENIITNVDTIGARINTGASQLTPQGEWLYFHDSGGGSPTWQGVTNAAGAPNIRTAITITETGSGRIVSPTGVEGFLVSQGDSLIVSAWSKSTAAGTLTALIAYYDSLGGAVSNSGNMALSVSTVFQERAYRTLVPDGAVYAAIQITAAGTSNFTLTGIRVVNVGLRGQSQIAPPLRRLKYVATLDFPDTASGATADLSVGLPGVLTTMRPGLKITPVAASYPAGMAWFDIFLASNNTGTARFYNNSGGNINPASGNFVIFVEY